MKALLLIIVCLSLSAAAPPREHIAGILNTGPSWTVQNATACGPGALFTFLLLTGHQTASLRSLQETLYSPKGASMLALRNAAKHFGCDVQIRHYRPQEIDSFPLPALVLFKNSDNTLIKGHYVVIYKVDKNSFYLIDGTTGRKRSGHKSHLSDFWTGYALAQTPRHFGITDVGRRPLQAGVFLVSAEMAIILCTMRHKKNGATKHKLFSEEGALR